MAKTKTELREWILSGFPGVEGGNTLPPAIAHE
jgi:hypothetical protein